MSYDSIRKQVRVITGYSNIDEPVSVYSVPELSLSEYWQHNFSHDFIDVFILEKIDQAIKEKYEDNN